MAPHLACIALLLCAVSSRATVTLDVDWQSFLARSDPVWEWNSTDTAPSLWTQSLFGGNGLLGFYVWTDAGLDNLRIDVGRTDVYDDRTAAGTPHAWVGNFVYDQPRLPIGNFRLGFVGTLVSATGSINLFDALVSVNLTTSVGRIQLVAWANAAVTQGDVIVLEVTATGGEAADVAFLPQSAQSTWADATYVVNPPPVNSSSPFPPGPTGSTLNLTSQHHLSGACHTTGVLTVLPTASTAAHAATRVYVSVSPVLPGGQAAADAYATSQVTAAAAAPLAALRASHSAWWHAWWPAGGFVTLPYSVLESFWYIQLYKFASGSRAGRAVHDLMGPWFIDGTPWPDMHWDMNVQQTYTLPLLANRPDLSSTLTDFLSRIHESGALAANVPLEWQVDSSAAPTGASSLSGAQTCYWNYGPNCTSSPPSITGNLLWACQLVYLAGQYAGNATVHTGVLFPILDRALQAYQHFQLNPNASTDGLTHLPTTFSPEYPGPPGHDANYDLALYRWGLTKALDLVARYNVSSSHAGAWASTLSTLTWYSIDAPSDTFSIYAGVPYDTPHRHYSHLFMIFPLRTLDVSNTTLATTARNSINRWLATPEEDSQFYRPAASAMNVLLQQRAAAFDNVTYLLHTRIEPNTFYTEGSQGSCTETPYAAAWAVADWYAQSWNSTGVPPELAGTGGDSGGTVVVPVLHFFPGIDDVIQLDGGAYTAAPAAAANASFFRLGAEGGFLLSAARAVSPETNATHYVTFATFLAVDVPPAYAHSILVVRSSMPQPWVTVPPGLTLTPLWDDAVAVSGVEGGMTVVLSPPGAPPTPTRAVQAVPGCPADFNAWGYHPKGAPSVRGGRRTPLAHVSARQPSAVTGGSGGGEAVVSVVLRNCSYEAGGLVAPTQRYTYDNTTGVFALQDGSGRCLTVSTCAGANGDRVLLAPCSGGAGSTPVGCEADCTATAQAWSVSGDAATPPNAIRTTLSGRCMDVNGAFSPDDVDVWDCGSPPGAYRNEEFTFVGTTGAVLSLDTAPGLLGTCLTPAE